MLVCEVVASVVILCFASIAQLVRAWCLYGNIYFMHLQRQGRGFDPRWEHFFE